MVLPPAVPVRAGQLALPRATMVWSDSRPSGVQGPCTAVLQQQQTMTNTTPTSALVKVPLKIRHNIMSCTPLLPAPQEQQGLLEHGSHEQARTCMHAPLLLSRPSTKPETNVTGNPFKIHSTSKCKHASTLLQPDLQHLLVCVMHSAAVGGLNSTPSQSGSYQR